MDFQSKYVAHVPDKDGIVKYSEIENKVWQKLFTRQWDCIQSRAAEAYVTGLSDLSLNSDSIPQVPDLTEVLRERTHWSVEPVEALISAREFFTLLARRVFPVATFIRSEAELDYVTEPDVFHEVFGHCPMLTEPVYADFLQAYAKMVLTFPEDRWPLLQRFFWFTVEFGLIEEPKGLKTYGGGILSSFEETKYCVESPTPERRPFSVVDILRTPYRIDILQPIYYVISSYEQLFGVIDVDFKKEMARAHELGEFEPTFEPGPLDITHINHC